jgi:hypothetical protein
LLALPDAAAIAEAASCYAAGSPTESDGDLCILVAWSYAASSPTEMPIARVHGLLNIDVNKGGVAASSILRLAPL